jgi:hypothetical protein
MGQQLLLVWARAPIQRQQSGAHGRCLMLWQTHFELSFDQQTYRWHMDSFRGKPLLVNFWANRCVEELPLLDFFTKENKAKTGKFC